MLTLPKEVGQVFVPFCTSKAKVLCNKILSLAFSGLHETGRIDYDRLGKNIFLYEPGYKYTRPKECKNMIMEILSKI